MSKIFIEKIKYVKIKDLFAFLLFFIAIPIAQIYKYFRKNLWLICEDENEARDNGYYLFKYINKNQRHIDCVYAINKKSIDYAKVKEIGEVISYGTLVHWIYYLCAKKNISTQKGGKPNAAVCYFLEIYKIINNKRYFLQHGITINDAQWLHYNVTKFSLFVCGAYPEFKYVTENFGYPKNFVKYLGFCRFDHLHNIKIKTNQILIMPTWREFIARPTKKSLIIDDIKNFQNTNYFKSWDNLLKDKKLHDFLNEKEITIIFFPHRNMQKFINYFSSVYKNIVIADWKKYDVQQLLKESAMLITDYSSVAMDFAYMCKPILFYQFDYKIFRAEQYGEGYFSYENDGFGSVSYNKKDLVKNIFEIVNNNFKVNEKYLEKQKIFFPLHDEKNCERNFRAIEDM